MAEAIRQHIPACNVNVTAPQPRNMAKAMAGPPMPAKSQPTFSCLRSMSSALTQAGSKRGNAFSIPWRLLVMSSILNLALVVPSVNFGFLHRDMASAESAILLLLAIAAQPRARATCFATGVRATGAAAGVRATGAAAGVRATGAAAVVRAAAGAAVFDTFARFFGWCFLRPPGAGTPSHESSEHIECNIDRLTRYRHGGKPGLVDPGHWGRGLACPRQPARRRPS